MANLDLCNLDRLWKNVSLTEPANIISEYSQDYVCLMSETGVGNETLSLNIDNLFNNCISDIGSIRVIQPKNSDNTFTINPSNIYPIQISKITAGPNTEVRCIGDGDKTKRVNLLKIYSSKVTIRDLDFLSSSDIITSTNTILTNITGFCDTQILNSPNININNCFVRNATIDGSTINLNTSNFDSCKILSNLSLSITENTAYKFVNCFISGYNIEYSHQGVTNSVAIDFNIQNHISLSNVGIINSSFKGFGNNTTVLINSLRALKNSDFDNIYGISITGASDPNPPAEPAAPIAPIITDSLEAKSYINLTGPGIDDGQRIIINNDLNSRYISLSFFENNGIIYADQGVTLVSGINNGSIFSKNISLDGVVNNGTITRIA